MSEWKKVKIGEFLFERIGRYKPKDKEIGGLKRLEKINFSGNFYIGNKISNTDMILIKKGDLVISGINVAKGAMGIYRGSDDITATIHYSSYTFDEKIIDIDYFEYFLKSSNFVKLLNEQVRGGIKTEIKPKHLLPLDIKLPDIKTQKIIVSRIKKNIEKNNYINKSIEDQKIILQKLRQAILQDAIEGKLTADWRKKNLNVEPARELLKKIKVEKEKLIAEKKIKKEKPLPEISKEEILFELPERWGWCRLGEITQHNSGKTLDSGRNKGKLREYITTSNLYWGYFILDKLKKMPIKDNEMEKCKAIKGDLLICEGGESGRSAIWNEDYDICFQNHIHRVRPYCSVSSSYIYWFFQKINLSGEINKYRKGMGISNLSGKSLSLIPFPLPPLVEQEVIVEKVETLMQKLDKLEVEISQNQKTADMLMQAVLKEAFEKELFD